MAVSESPVNRQFLERLSTEELIRMADHYGVDMPPDLERIFVIEQLLELAAEEEEFDSEEDALPAAPLAEAEFPEQAGLPKQYNISFMNVIVRDPLWVFVFWELRSAEKEIFEASPDFEGYYLKVASKDSCGKGAGSDFSVPVGNDDTSWYIGFTSRSETEDADGLRYQVELCALKGGEEIALVSSAAFKLPALARKKGGDKKEGGDGSLVFLSGIDELPILRNGDRQPRMKARERGFSE